ncbi:cytochrome P450 [Hyalangium gracile]|uniref:cytochrome P450 n=1 Tax=Hyalangium gracile TaxID=394092 RepID=UPI001CCADE24|nr:cytochrome P450 [Hyalangium gracile]
MSLTLRGPRLPLLPTLRVIVNPIGVYQEWSARYGDPFLAKLPSGLLAITGNPEGIKEFFTADPNIFVPNTHTLIEPLLGTYSLLLLAGERHKRERQLLIPTFHGERMRSYGKLMQEITHRAMEGVRPGDQVLGLHLTQNISMEIIIRAVFGVEEAERVRSFVVAISDLTTSYGPVLAMWKSTRRSFAGLGPWDRFQERLASFNVMLMDQIQRRRASNAPGEDILSLLLSVRDEDGQPMTDEQIKDELRTFLLAGHETSAITMAWVLQWLHLYPEVREKLAQELAPLGSQPEAEKLARLPYLSAVVDETLRMCPVFPLTPRRLIAPFTLLGHQLPPGMGVAAAITLVHNNPTLYPEPQRFRPERFLERKYSPFEFIPFGGGARRCIGMAFANYEIKIVVGTLMAAYRFSLENPRPAKVVRRNLTLGPNTPIPMRYEGEARNVAAAA